MSQPVVAGEVVVPLELELPQVNFLLTVRKAGLQTLSIPEVVRLLEDISIMTQSVIMNKGYSIVIRTQFDGVMT